MKKLHQHVQMIRGIFLTKWKTRPDERKISWAIQCYKKKDNTRILYAALAKIRMSRVFILRQNPKKRKKTREREPPPGNPEGWVWVGNGMLSALCSLPELITKPQPRLRRSNQCDGMEGFWCALRAFRLSSDWEPVFWLSEHEAGWKQRSSAVCSRRPDKPSCTHLQCWKSVSFGRRAVERKQSILVWRHRGASHELHN